MSAETAMGKWFHYVVLSIMLAAMGTLLILALLTAKDLAR